MPRYTNFPNGIKSYPRDDNTFVKTGSYTVTAADCIAGKTLLMDSPTAATFTLPILTSVVGGLIVLVNCCDGVLLTVDPNAADGIAFGNQVVDGVTLVNPAATAKKGDFVTLISVGAGATAATYWTVAARGGIWGSGA